MKTSYRFLFILTIAAFYVQSIAAQESRPWFQDEPWRPTITNPKAKALSLIKVQGNKFVNSKGETVLFRGMAISDPDKLERQGHWSKKYFEKVKEMGALIIRIPVHPIAWRERTPLKYLELLDQAVEWSTDLGLYVLIDWHSIGNLGMEIFQNPMYNTSKQETFQFWRTIAQHFKGNNTVVFYEIFNEPTTYRGELGTIAWSEWKKINEDIINLIRAYDSEKIPLVAGFDWAYDLTPIINEPINAEGIGYVSHPYSNKRSQPWEPKWEENFGFAANMYPIVVTEFGFELRSGETIDTNHYSTRIVKFMEGRGISWICWVFDAEWGPSILKSWDNYELTGSGEFFKKALQGELEFQNKK
jgi:aryl-phospho-beta-D-glucosidase BglC (GH1 family)